MAINVGTLTAIFKAVDQFTGTAKRITGSAEGMAGKFQKAGDRITGIGVTAVKALAGIGVAGGIAAVGFIGAATKMASGFQDQMAILSVAASGSGLSMDTLRAAALAVGGDVTLVGVSATGAADSMTGLMKAGLSTTEIFGDLQGFLAGTSELSGALRASIDLAAASELDMVQASDLAAIALATFGTELKTEAERADFVNFALNNMVKAADASVAEVGDLAAALKNVGPTAASFGFGIEDVNTALAILSTRGINGAEAGTALKSMMTNLMRPTKDVKNTLRDLNVSLFDAEGNMKALPTIVGDLSEALFGMQEVTTVTGGRTAEQNELLKLAKSQFNSATRAITKHEAGLKTLSDKSLANYIEKQTSANAVLQDLEGITGTASTSMEALTEEQRLQAIQTLAGTFGMKAMATLVGEGVEGWEGMTDAIASAAGMQEVAFAKTQTLSGAMEAFGGVIETLMIKIGDQFLPVAESFVRWSAGVAEKHGPRLIAIIEKVVGAFLKLIEQVRGFGLGALFSQFEDGSSIIQSFFENLGVGEDTAGDIANAFFGIVDAFKKVVEVIVDNKDAIVGAIQAIAGAVAALVIVTRVTKVASALASLTNPLTLIIFLIALLGAAWKTNWGDIQGKTAAVIKFLAPIFASLNAWLSVLIPKALKALSKFWTGTLLPAIKTVWKFVLNTLIPAFQKLISFLVSVLAPIIEAVATLIIEQFQKAVVWVEDNWPLIQETIQTVLEFIQDIIQTVLGAIQAFWDEHGVAIMEAATQAWEAIRTVIDTVTSVIQGIITAVMQVITGDWTGAHETLRMVAETAWEVIKSAVETALNLLRDVIIPAAIEGITSVLALAWQGIQLAAEIAWTLITEAIKLAFDWLWTTGLPGAIEVLKAGLVLAWQGIQLAAEAGWILITQAIKLAFDWLWTTGLPAAIAALKAILFFAWEAIQLAAETGWTLVKEAISTVVQELLEVVKTKITELKSTIETLWSEIKTATSKKWEEIKAAIKLAVDALPGIIEGIGAAMQAAGGAIIDKVREGMETKFGELTTWFSARLTDLTDLLPFSEPAKGPASPLFGLGKSGEAFVDNILTGFQKAFPKLEAALAQLSVPGLEAIAAGGGGTMRRGGDIFNQGGDISVNVTDPLGAEIILEEINARQFETIERTM